MTTHGDVTWGKGGHVLPGAAAASGGTKLRSEYYIIFTKC